MDWGFGAAVVALVVSASATAGMLLAGPAPSADVTAPLMTIALAGIAAFGIATRRRQSRRLRAAVLLVGGALLVLAVIVPPASSGDVWSYAMYGRILGHHHRNPYLVAPSAFPHDAFLAHVPRAWRATKSVYGPGFTVLSAAITSTVGRSPRAARVVFQLLDAGAVGLVLALLVRRRVPTFVVAALALNPVVVYWVVNGGHNDALVGVALLAAALAASRRPAWVVGGALALAISIKIAALLPTLALVWWAWPRRGRRFAAVAGATAIAPVAAGYALFGGVVALRPLAHAASNVSRATLWDLVPHRGGNLAAVPHTVATLLVVVLAVALVWRHRRSSAPAIALGATVAYLVGAAYVLPWYAAWALPLAALEHRSRVARLVFVESAVLALAYTYRAVPDPDTLDRVLRAFIATTRVSMLAVTVTILVVAVLRPARQQPASV